jgi:hypothetical protein
MIFIKVDIQIFRNPIVPYHSHCSSDSIHLRLLGHRVFEETYWSWNWNILKSNYSMTHILIFWFHTCHVYNLLFLNNNRSNTESVQGYASWKLLVIISHLSKKERQCNCKQKTDIRTDSNIQNTAQKTKDFATLTPLQTSGEPMCSGVVSSYSCYKTDELASGEPMCSGVVSSYSCYKPDDNSWMMKGPHCEYDKRNINVVICDTDISQRLTKSWWWP